MPELELCAKSREKEREWEKKPETHGRKFKFKSVSFQVQRSGDGDVNVEAALKVITIEFYRRQAEAGDEGSSNNNKKKRQLHTQTRTHNATDKLTQKFLQLPLLRVLNEFTLLSPGILIRIKLLSQRLAKVCHAEVIKAKRAAEKLILMAKEKRREI